MLLADGNKCSGNFMMCLRLPSFYFKFDRIGLDHELKFDTSCSDKLSGKCFFLGHVGRTDMAQEFILNGRNH